jgi:hypothetical protein
MKWHPYAENYPLLKDEAYDDFKADIADRGVHEAVKYRIVNGEKEYLDGRNRVQACKDLRVTWPEERVEVADDQVEQYIDSLNLHRRHLSAEQRKARVDILRQRGQSTCLTSPSSAWPGPRSRELCIAKWPVGGFGR